MGLGNALSWLGRKMPLTRYPPGHTAGITQESEEVSVNVFLASGRSVTGMQRPSENQLENCLALDGRTRWGAGGG